MTTITNSSKKLDPRNELRHCERVFLEIEDLTSKDIKVDALTSDVSDSGIGLLTYLPFPVGTRVSLSVNGQLIAIGEVTNVDPWECYGLTRMGVRLLQKEEDAPL